METILRIIINRQVLSMTEATLAIISFFLIFDVKNNAFRAVSSLLGIVLLIMSLHGVRNNGSFWDSSIAVNISAIVVSVVIWLAYLISIKKIKRVFDKKDRHEENDIKN